MKKGSSSEFVVVGIGASAGGAHALKRFFSKVDIQNVAIIIAQHLEPSGKNLALENLHQITDLPVDEIVDGAKITPGRIFLCPPQMLVSINEESFVCQSAHEPAMKYATIDWLFESLAKNFTDRSVGVILSGEGIDGTLGLKSISEFGGLTLAQDEKSSEYTSMPHHAAELGIVDHMIAPENMPLVITEHVKFLTMLEKKVSSAALHEEIGASIISICEILLKHTHHDFKHYKTSTLVRRIQRRMLVLQAPTVDAYVEVLKSSVKERDSLFNDLLINVTSFFRDPEAFEALKNEVLVKMLPQVIPGRKFRIWVAGCSTGEEAYTMAMLVRETMEEKGLKGEVQIIATDIDEEALNMARKGEYPLSITERVSPERLDKFFQRRNGRFIVNKQLREIILFSSHNLINDPPFSQLDLISCRNVLIYLGMHLQKKLIPVFHYALRPSGYLFLGTSEALSSHKELFNTENLKFRIAQRKATAITHSHSFLTSMSTTYSGHFKEAPKNSEEDLLLIGQRILLDEFSPKFAIINEDMQILTISSGFNDYLEPGEGSFQNNITKLVKQNLRAALRSSISEAKKQKRQIQNYSSFLQTSRGVQKVGIVVQPMPQLGGQTGLFMVVFKDQGLINEEMLANGENSGINVEMVEELEKELSNLRADLDKTVQDLEASNEELKSSNEELLSMNEELQSANEELEISKEEIQFANDTLLRTNVDLENFLNSTKIATIFLDENLNIRNFTPAVSNLYDLVQHDIGRSINNFTSKAINMPAYSAPKDLKPDQIVETEVALPDGRVYLRRKSAYLDKDHKQAGLVVTFVDVTELRRSEGSFKTLANSVPQMIWMTDEKGNYLYFSEQWRDFSGLDPASIRNKGFREIIHPDDIEEAIKAWTQAQGNNDNFSYEYRLRDRDGIYHWHLLKARSMKDATGKIFRWFGTCTNIESQKTLENSLKKTQQDLLRNVDRFNRVADAVELGVWFCDLPFDVLSWSETVKKHFWLPAEAHVTIDTFYERIHPDDRERTQKAIEFSIVNNSHYDINYRTTNPTATEEIKLIRAIGWTDYNSEGNPIRFDGITLDVTESNKLMTNLAESETRYSLASKATRDLIWDWNLVTSSVLWNDALVREMGYTPEEQDSSATWWYEHIHPEDRDRVVHGIHEVIDRKESFWSDEYRFINADGNYGDFLDQGYIQVDEAGSAIRMIGSMMNITERNNAINKMKEAIDARDEFLSIASHELKTPLTSIMLKIQMLQRQIIKGDNATENIDRTNALVLKQCRLLTSLIDDMLDVSRIATGRLKYNLEKIDLNEVVSHALEVFSVNLEQKNISVETSIEKNISIFGDAFRLEQVVYNVLNNALKYGMGKPIKLEVLKENNEAVIRVSDHGLGINEEDLGRIFQRFERATTSKISGLGLGLYISKQIIDAHSGTIKVKSELGTGSEFTIRLAITK